MPRRFFRLILLFCSLGAFFAADAFAESCPLSPSLTFEEQKALYEFYADLSHLNDHYGKSEFDAALNSIVEKKWPKTKFSEVSSTFYERVSNLVDQARLTNSIALTIGLDNKVWHGFSWLMREISIGATTGGSTEFPLQKTSLALIREIAKLRSAPGSVASAKDVAVAEALLRASDMYAYLVRWKAIKGEIIDEQASASAQKVAMITVGLVGVGVLSSSLAFTSPAIAASGLWASSLPVSPAIAGLVTKTTELAVGSMMGVYGSPAAYFIHSAYQNITTAEDEVLNRRTNLACELSLKIDAWKRQAPDKLLSGAVAGATKGAAAGVLSLSKFTASLIMPYVIGGGLVEEGFLISKIRKSFLEAAALYRLAEEAEAANQHEKALELLYRSREISREGGEHVLEALVVGAISGNSSKEFKKALRHGAEKISELLRESGEDLGHVVDATRQTIEAVKKSPNAAPASRKQH